VLCPALSRVQPDACQRGHQLKRPERQVIPGGRSMGGGSYIRHDPERPAWSRDPLNVRVRSIQRHDVGPGRHAHNPEYIRQLVVRAQRPEVRAEHKRRTSRPDRVADRLRSPTSGLQLVPPSLTYNSGLEAARDRLRRRRLATARSTRSDGRAADRRAVPRLGGSAKCDPLPPAPDQLT
jgi:hypothetical protein